MNMRNYELISILRPDLDKEAYDEIRQKISSAVTKGEGQVKSWNPWKENYRFSYILRSRGAEKKKYAEGTYVISEIMLDPQKLNTLKYTLDLEERIIRYLVINKDAK
jgi:ribosomal protein S6